ncbi:MAG TPA: universal stress protein [Vicinamibacterales bacterium]|nr:universal stress protein [Vicinamibacterales bacterium]
MSHGPVVCGVDFSDRSRSALAAAIAFAARLKAPVLAVSAIDELLAHAADAQYGPGQLIADTRRDLEAFVSGSAAKVGVAVDVRVATGPAAKVICEAADAAHATCIVVGSRGHGPAKRFWFGSTTSRVLVSTKVPVLAVSGAPDVTTDAAPLAFDHIVCGVDFQPPSRAAAERAATLGRDLKVPVTLVTGVASPAGPPSVRDAIRATAADLSDRAKTQLDQLAAALPGPPATRVMIGGAADVLLDAVEGSGRALLVVGIGGGTTHRPGSTATKLLTHGGVPVLAVPARG